MTSQNVTLSIPEPLYQHLKQRADQARRSVEEETLEVLAGAVPASSTLPEGLTEIVTMLQTLDDASLWQAARSRLPAEISRELEALHFKQQRAGLTASEQQELAALLRQYEQQMLIRGQAAALLKQRGHDVREIISS
jgi:hypothetical protein